jgi:uncharacterized protein (DUF2267 family)
MDRTEFIEIVTRAISGDADTAELGVHAVLQTLGERFGAEPGGVRVAGLPPELRPWLHAAGLAQRFDAEEFVRRVAEREGTDLAIAERHVRAVLIALSRAMSDDEYRDLAGRLSADYAPLLPKGADVGAVPVEVFLSRVGDPATARHATGAVLETLAERIATRQTDDLLSRLPVALHAPLKRGRDHADPTSRRMDSDEFLARVARRARVTPDQAREYTRAVFAALREVVLDPEFFDVTVQLPPDYETLLEAPGRP